MFFWVPSMSFSHTPFPRWKIWSVQCSHMGAGQYLLLTSKRFLPLLPKTDHSIHIWIAVAQSSFFILFGFWPLLTIVGISSWISARYFLDTFRDTCISLYPNVEAYVADMVLYCTLIARSLILHCLLWNQYVFRGWNHDIQFRKQWIVRDLFDSRKPICMKN